MLTRWNHVLLALNSSINIVIYAAKVTDKLEGFRFSSRHIKEHSLIINWSYFYFSHALALSYSKHSFCFCKQSILNYLSTARAHLLFCLF